MKKLIIKTIFYINILMCVFSNSCNRKISSPTGRWQFSGSYGVNAPPVDSSKYIEIKKNGNFEGYLYSVEGFYLASGDWVISEKKSENTDLSIIFTVKSINNKPIKYFMLDMDMFDGYMLDQWDGPDNPIKYSKNKYLDSE